MRGCIVAVIFQFCFYQANGFARHLNSIPNARYVPDPCDPTQHWARVGGTMRNTNSGHKRGISGSNLNGFGQHFKDNDFTWTVALCQMDSDNDGVSNGQELGDPNCEWAFGLDDPVLPDGAYITHPGICEPLTSDNCRMQNDWLNDDNCEALTFGLGPPCGEGANMGHILDCDKCKGKKNGWYKCKRFNPPKDIENPKPKKCCCLSHKPKACPPCKVLGKCGDGEKVNGEIMKCKCCKKKFDWYKCPKENPGGKMCCCTDDKLPRKLFKQCCKEDN